MSSNGDNTDNADQKKQQETRIPVPEVASNSDSNIETQAEIMKKMLTEFLPSITMSVAKQKSSTELYTNDSDDMVSLNPPQSELTDLLPPGLRDSAMGSIIKDKENLSPPPKRLRLKVGSNHHDNNRGSNPDKTGEFNPMKTGQDNPDEEHGPALDLSFLN